MSIFSVLCVFFPICICAEQSSRHISLSWCALSPHLPHQRLVLGLSRWLVGHLYWWDSRIAWESPIKEASSSTANEPLSMQNVSAAGLWWASNRIRWGGLTLLKLIVIVDHIAALCMGPRWWIPKFPHMMMIWYQNPLGSIYFQSSMHNVHLCLVQMFELN